jgi:polysaccharide biosynthesis/export protein
MRLMNIRTQLIFIALAILFLSLPSRAQPTDSRDYVLGAGDIVRINVFEHPDMATEARLSESGKIRFPLIGEVGIAGLSVSGAEGRIADQLRTGGYVKKPEVSIIVTQFRGQQASVLGQVNRPGRYPIEGPTKLSDLLAIAGGVTSSGADQITLTRKVNGKVSRTEVNQIAAFQSGELSLDIPIENGDVLFIGRAPQYYIHGEVQRPGSFRLESNMTIAQALAIGGGVTARGSDREIRLTRRDSSGKPVTTTPKSNDFVMADDVLLVNPAQFYIYGEVQRPGTFKVEPNMTVMQALAMGGGVTSRGTDRGMKLVRRDKNGKLVYYDAVLEDFIQTDDVIYVKERLF